MSKAILVIDNIPESLFTENLSIEYQLLYYPDGHVKELGIHGKQLLKPMPERKYAIQGMKGYTSTLKECKGWNDCLDAIMEDEE